jgi:hypothetical protein
MPDGKPLSYYLRLDREKEERRSQRRQARGKDEIWAQLQQHKKSGGMSDLELAELRALESVGRAYKPFR